MNKNPHYSPTFVRFLMCFQVALCAVGPTTARKCALEPGDKKHICTGSGESEQEIYIGVVDKYVPELRNNKHIHGLGIKLDICLNLRMMFYVRLN